MRILAIFATLYLFSGCSGVDIQRYVDHKPEFNLYNYFLGSTTGWGIVQDRKGNLSRQFVVSIEGKINESGDLVLTEDFLWNDGLKTARIWTISQIDDHTFRGSAADIVGLATGTSAGNVLNWSYYLNLEVENRTWKIHFDDWMFLQENDVLINRAKMSKWGFHVGEVTIVFQKKR